MSNGRFSMFVALILCLVLQGSGLSFASARGLADCGMDMQQMTMVPTNTQQKGHDHSAMHHAPMSSAIQEAPHEPLSVEADCCDVDAATRGDCTNMPDCHSCGSMISLSLPNNTDTSVVAPSTIRRLPHLPALRAFSPPDLWRPPILS